MDRKKLSLDAEEMRSLGYQVVDLLVDHFSRLPEKPVTRKAERGSMEALFREPIPERGAAPSEVLERVREDVFAHIMHLDHPRFYAFVPSPSNFVSVMAEALASGFNVFAGTWLEASAPAQIELVTIDWLRQLFGLPESAGGLFTSGGSMANLTALALARHEKLRGRSAEAVVYCSDQAHSSVERALRVLGFESGQLRKLPSDSSFRLSVESLQQAVQADRAQGRLPFCVVANAGTTNTGSVDPLPQVADLCRSENLWLHADGAYGGASILSPRGRLLLEGIDGVDSLALDPHKWLFQPYETGCLLVRDRAQLKEAFQVRPEYLKDAESAAEEVNFCDYGVQLTRSFRALKLWMSLQVFGRAGFQAAVEHGFQLAESAEKILHGMDDWEVTTPAQLGVLTFRCAPASLSPRRIDDLNRSMVDPILRQGFSMIVTTQLRGRPVLRLCPINPRTADKDIHDTLTHLERLRREAT